VLPSLFSALVSLQYLFL